MFKKLNMSGADCWYREVFFPNHELWYELIDNVVEWQQFKVMFMESCWSNRVTASIWISLQIFRNWPQAGRLDCCCSGNEEFSRGGYSWRKTRSSFLECLFGKTGIEMVRRILVRIPIKNSAVVIEDDDILDYIKILQKVKHRDLMTAMKLLMTLDPDQSDKCLNMIHGLDPEFEFLENHWIVMSFFIPTCPETGLWDFLLSINYCTFKSYYWED